jgi:hypothetical protein
MKTKLNKKLGKGLSKVIETFYNDFKLDYEKFVDNVERIKDALAIQNVTVEEIYEVYNEAIINTDNQHYIDENGNEIEDTLIESEGTSRLIDEVINNGWINEKIKQKIIKDKPFNLFIENTKIARNVKDDITKNSFHILGLCNNPNKWGENRQGVTMGMVQSGKTVSMLCLTSMALSVGYKLIIFLTGNKESLRVQTQERINSTFNFEMGEVEYGNKRRIYSPTNKSSYNYLNYIDTFRPKSDDVVILTILKETQNLKKLNNDINLIKEFCTKYNVDYDNRYPTLILDDESDFASLDTSPNEIKGIHEQLVKLRKNIKKNCFVGYTATPQGCLAAKPDSPVGYPKDFIWLLEPIMSPNNPINTLSYMGLHEFFIQYRSDIINILPQDVWPHYQKRIDGKNEGIYNPLTKGIEPQASMQILEEKCMDYFLNNNTKIPTPFLESLMQFIITCGIQWFRHRNEVKPGSIPTIDEIESGYPYQAMMFNLTLSKSNHKLTKNLVQLCFRKVELEFLQWKKNKKSKFDFLWNQQIEKTKRLRGQIDYNENGNEIKYFCELAIKILKRPITATTDYVYILNGDKESDVLNYDVHSGRDLTKKCAVFVGGNILSRGLTIEGLTNSFFIRSQAATIMDTSLQMCRWFGHKKHQLDLLSLYLTAPMLNLFIDVAKCDDGLRKSMKAAILKNEDPQKILIELWSTKLFSVTSKQKSKSLQKSKKSAIAYTGNTSQLLEPFANGDVNILDANTKIFDNFLKSIKYKEIPRHLNRGSLYRDISLGDTIKFLKEIIIPSNALYVTPFDYAQYLDDWNQEYLANRIMNPVPTINIGYLSDFKNSLSERQRDFRIAPQNIKEAIENQRLLLTQFLGGRSPNGKYKGDAYYDREEAWHTSNASTKKFREVGDSILLLFIKIDPNYLNKKFQLRKNDTGYLKTKDGVLTFAAVTPMGGPYYQVYTNKLISI